MTTDALDTNLLASHNKKEKEPEQLPTEAESKKKKWAKLAIYVLVFFLSFFFFASLKLPNTFFKGIVLGALNQNNSSQWQADQLSFRFFWLPHIRAENLGLVPSAMSDMPALTFDQMRIFPSFFSLLPLTGSFRPAASFDGSAYGAEFEGWVQPAKPELELSVTQADLSKMTPLLEKGIDLKGILDLTLQLALENQRLSRSNGTFTLKGKSFVVDPSAFGVPLPLPILDLGGIDLEGNIQNGRVRLQKAQVGTPGKDLEIRATGEIQLMDNPSFSRLDLRVQLKPADKILSAMPALKTMLATIAAEQPGGFYAMKVSGTLMQMGMPTPDR